LRLTDFGSAMELTREVAKKVVLVAVATDQNE
jgi:hypothetical protein